MSLRLFAYATEKRVAAELLERGFKIAIPEGAPGGDDLYAKWKNDWFSIQIKTTSFKQGLYYQVRLYTANKDRPGKKSRSDADFHIIRARGEPWHWVIPTREMGGFGSSFVLTPKYDKFKDAWDLLKEVRNGATQEQLAPPNPDDSGNLGVVSKQEGRQGRVGPKSGKGKGRTSKSRPEVGPKDGDRK